MPPRRSIIALIALSLSLTAARPARAAQPEELLPRAALEKLYAAEIPKYDPASFDKLYAAHQLLEKYFVADANEDRKTLVKSLDASGVDAATLGRMCHIRLGWPALAPGVAHVKEDIPPHHVQYFLGLPKDYDRTKSWPLVIRLPAVNVLITDPAKPPTADEVVRLYSDWMNDELTRHPDAVVIMPRLNLDEFYGPSVKGMNTVIQAMHDVAGKVNIDPARVYMVGHGMAGHAVWNLALHYTTYFAAINPLAGAASGDWQRVRLLNLRNILPVVWADTTDKIINSNQSGAIVSVLKNFKYDVVFEQTRNMGHVPTPDMVEKCYVTLRGRTRELYPKQVNLRSTRPDPTFNRIDWLQVYQPLTPGAEKHLTLRKGTGQIIVNENTHSVQAALTGPQKIEAKTDNIASLRFYLNDQMMDLTQPVVIIINGKGRFEGIVKPSIDEMLRDQLFIGRGWRYFTAAVDIDLVPPRASTTQPSNPSSGSSNSSTGAASGGVSATPADAPDKKFFFTIDEGKTIFTDLASTRPPFTHEGKPAYQAHIFSIDNGKTKFIGYLSKYSAVAGESLVRRPGEIHWAPASSASGAEITNVRGPEATGARAATEIFPQ